MTLKRKENFGKCNYDWPGRRSCKVNQLVCYDIFIQEWCSLNGQGFVSSRIVTIESESSPDGSVMASVCFR